MDEGSYAPTSAEDDTVALSQTSQGGDDLAMVVDPLIRYTARLAMTEEPSAPVSLPNREELTVRLVNVSQLQRLDELRSDTGLLQTLLGTVAGGLVGFLVNAYTSNSVLDRQAWIFLIFLALVAAAFGALTHRAGMRAERLRKKLFDDDRSEKPGR